MPFDLCGRSPTAICKSTGNSDLAQSNASAVLEPVASNGIGGARQSQLVAGRVDEVLHQRRHGHRTGPAGIERDPSRDFLHCFEIDIANELAGTDASEADVNHAGAPLHHVGGDQIRTARVGADAWDENIGLAANGGEVARVAMTPSDRCVAQTSAKNQRRRLACDIATADDDGARTVDRYLVVLEQSEHSAWRARNKASPLTAVESADAGRADGVEILFGRDSVEQAEAVD